MSNRTLLYLSFVVLGGMAILLALNISYFFTGKSINQTYLKYNAVRGIAVDHQQLLYTLNFEQQNSVIEMINRSVPVAEVKPGQRQKPAIEKIIVYQFENLPDITLTPIAIVNGNLVFSVPQWIQDGYLMDLSDGDFQKLLAQTYDP